MKWFTVTAWKHHEGDGDTPVMLERIQADNAAHALLIFARAINHHCWGGPIGTVTIEELTI